MRYNIVEHLPTVRILHDEEDGCWRVKNFIKLDDVLMTISLQYLYLACHPLHIGNLDNPTLLQDFYCNLR